MQALWSVCFRFWAQYCQAHFNHCYLRKILLSNIAEITKCIMSHNVYIFQYCHENIAVFLSNISNCYFIIAIYIWCTSSLSSNSTKISYYMQIMSIWYCHTDLNENPVPIIIVQIKNSNIAYDTWPNSKFFSYLQ